MLLIDKPVFLTRQGYHKFQAKLDYLYGVKRAEIAEYLQDTSTGGDSLDNTEYITARYEQLMLDMQIRHLQDLLARAQIIDGSANGEVVCLGSRVVIRDNEQQEETYSIVGSPETDPDQGFVSDESPLGKALLHHQVGDVIEVEAPEGIIQYHIVAII